MDDIDIYTGEVVESKEGAPSFGYDPVKDIRPVDPMGFIDIRDAYVNRNVPTNVSEDVMNYNNIEDPESILGTARDIFEAYRMRDYVQSVSKKSSSESVSSVKDEN